MRLKGWGIVLVRFWLVVGLAPALPPLLLASLLSCKHHRHTWHPFSGVRENQHLQQLTCFASAVAHSDAHSFPRRHAPLFPHPSLTYLPEPSHPLPFRMSAH